MGGDRERSRRHLRGKERAEVPVRDLRVGGGDGDCETLQEGLGGREIGRETGHRVARSPGLGGPCPSWEGRESGVERPHRERHDAPGLWSLTGVRGTARAPGFAEPERAEGSRGCAGKAAWLTPLFPGYAKKKKRENRRPGSADRAKGSSRFPRCDDDGESRCAEDQPFARGSLMFNWL